MESLYNFNLSSPLSSSKEILKKSMQLYKPYKTVAAFSGGDDSLTMMEVLKHLGHRVDYAMFADTGTCIPATLEFVKHYCEENGIRLLIAKPKKTLEEMVLKNGFLGLGNAAHNLAFGELKGKPMRDIISKEIRQGQRNRNVVIFSGVRRNESRQRQTSRKYESPFWQEKQGKRKDGTQVYSPNIWSCLIHSWSKEDTLEFLEMVKQKRNPVSVKLGRSGDCHCGTAIGNPASEFEELKENAPVVAQKISELNQYCIDKNLTQWCEPRLKSNFLENMGQGNLFCGLDLCKGCKNRYTLALSKINK